MKSSQDLGAGFSSSSSHVATGAGSKPLSLQLREYVKSTLPKINRSETFHRSINAVIYSYNYLIQEGKETLLSYHLDNFSNLETRLDGQGEEILNKYYSLIHKQLAALTSLKAQIDEGLSKGSISLEKERVVCLDIDICYSYFIHHIKKEMDGYHSAVESIERAAKEAAERVAKEAAERVAKEAAERVAKEAAERVAEETARMIAELDDIIQRAETAERDAKEAAERTAKESAERTAKESAERTAETDLVNDNGDVLGSNGHVSGYSFKDNEDTGLLGEYSPAE